MVFWAGGQPEAQMTVTIDAEKCTGCGLCAAACRGRAIAIVDGKAKLTDESLCDGLGNCLPACPVSAISFADTADTGAARGKPENKGRRWPVQIQLVPETAPFLAGAHLLVAADCAAYTRAGFHADFMDGRVTVIGCPKLDNPAYAEKLRRIVAAAAPATVTVVRMEVPCCSGLERAAAEAVKASGKTTPLQIAALSTAGEIVGSREG